MKIIKIDIIYMIITLYNFIIIHLFQKKEIFIIKKTQKIKNQKMEMIIEIKKDELNTLLSALLVKNQKYNIIV